MIPKKKAGPGPSPMNTPGPADAKRPPRDTPLPTYELAEFAEKFEQEILRKKLAGGREGRRLVILGSIWKASKRCILACDLNVREISRTPEVIFAWFTAEKISLGYAKKIIAMLNHWANFVSWERGAIPPPQIPFPRGFHRERIVDSNIDSGTNRRESQALTEEILKKAKETMRPDHWNWLFVSFWFGLRPKEVDKIRYQNGTNISMVNGVEVLAIYQSKLTQVPREKRWKYIPALLPQQQEALRIIRSGEMKRPHTQTIHRHLGRRIHSYGGRKGFSGALAQSGLDLKARSVMLGHKSIETTVRHYTDHQAEQLEKIKQLGGLDILLRKQ